VPGRIPLVATAFHCVSLLSTCSDSTPERPAALGNDTTRGTDEHTPSPDFRRLRRTLTSHHQVDDPVPMKHLGLLILVVLALCAVTPATAHAQYVQVEGWVLWLSANQMQLVLDNSMSVSVDLWKVPQTQYQGLRSGQRDRVVVVGVVAPDNQKIIA